MQSLTLRRTNLSAWVRVCAIGLFAVATALSARVSIPLPFSPVPLTLQVLVVVLSGLVLGWRDALIAQALYLQAVLLGCPATSTGVAGPAAFVMPTAGYLVSFPLAAAAAGWIGRRRAARPALWRGLAGAAALAVVYLAGMFWLSGYVGGLANAWRLGVLPFVGVDAAKIVLAVAALSLTDR